MSAISNPKALHISFTVLHRLRISGPEGHITTTTVFPYKTVFPHHQYTQKTTMIPH